MGKRVLSANDWIALAGRVADNEVSSSEERLLEFLEIEDLLKRPPGRTRRNSRDWDSRRGSRKSRAGTVAFRHTGPAGEVKSIYADASYPGWRTKASEVTRDLAHPKPA